MPLYTFASMLLDTVAVVFYIYYELSITNLCNLLSHLIFTTNLWGTTIILILEMKWWPSGKELAQGHTASKMKLTEE